MSDLRRLSEMHAETEQNLFDFLETDLALYYSAQVFFFGADSPKYMPRPSAPRRSTSSQNTRRTKTGSEPKSVRHFNHV